jgi:hypothetical protein
MKVCKVLMGPIAGNERNVDEGGEITLDDTTAKMFEGWDYVEILRDLDDGATSAGKAAPEPEPEPKPTTKRKAENSKEDSEVAT